MGIKPGYMGYAQIGGGDRIRYSDASFSAKQEVVTPDIIMGHWDRNSFYYGPITIDGSMSGPIDELFGGAAWTWATGRGPCGDCTNNSLDIVYYCRDEGDTGISSISVPEAMVNTFSINATAGDVANFSLDLIAAGKPTYGTVSSTGDDTTIRKLVTWDAMGLTLVGNDNMIFDTTAISAFEMTVNNNVTPVYSLGSGNLYPTTLISGLRQVTGSVTFYGVPTDNPAALDAYNLYFNVPGTITFTVGATTVNASVKFHRINPSSQVGPITSTLGFTGVGPQFV